MEYNGDPLSAAIVGGAGILSTGLGIAGNKQQYKYSKKLMNYQNELNIANWNMQNEYNSPVAQMQRYSDANLNPNLIYGSGSSAGNATSAPTAEGFDVKNPFAGVDLAQLAATVLNASNASQQQSNQNKMANANIEIAKGEARIKDITATFLEDTLEDRKSGVKYQNQLTLQNIWNIDNMTEYRDALIEKTKSETILTDILQGRNVAETALTWARFESELYRPAQIIADTLYKKASTFLTEQQCELIGQSILLKQIEVEIGRATKQGKIDMVDASLRVARETADRLANMTDTEVELLQKKADYYDTDRFMDYLLKAATVGSYFSH